MTAEGEIKHASSGHCLDEDANNDNEVKKNLYYILKPIKKEYGKVIIIASIRMQTMKIKLKKYEDH